MKKISYGLGFAAVASALILLGAGCGGVKYTATTKTQGDFNVRSTESGPAGSATVNVGGPNGFTAVSGGDARPASAPDDMPSLPGARNFIWLGTADSGTLAFQISSHDYKGLCDQEDDLLFKSGWQKDPKVPEISIENALTRSAVKTGYLLTLTCDDDGGKGLTRVTLSKNKN